MFVKEETSLDDIKTEGIKYIGSKNKLIPFILRLSQKVNPCSVFDGFSGTTRVSQAFFKTGCRVISNDISDWSNVFGYCYLINQKPAKYYQEIIDYLNNLRGVYGWFSEHYGGVPNEKCPKRPWQLHNTMKLDAIREEIDRIASDKIEKSVLLTSLILALDKVDNTIGHYSSYLRNWSPRSYNVMQLKVPQLIINPNQNNENQVYQDDIFNICHKISADLAYFDPPYSSNNNKMPSSRVRYNSYYHIWTTIIKNDKPKLFGNNNRRLDSSDKVSYSPFEDFRKDGNENYIAATSIKKLIQLTQCKYIIFSYSSGGRVPFNTLMDIFSKNADILEIQKMNYRKNVMSYMKWTNQWTNDLTEEGNNSHQEYLFLLEKR